LAGAPKVASEYDPTTATRVLPASVAAGQVAVTVHGQVAVEAAVPVAFCLR